MSKNGKTPDRKAIHARMRKAWKNRQPEEPIDLDWDENETTDVIDLALSELEAVLDPAPRRKAIEALDRSSQELADELEPK